jgi:hypothetical protein
MEPAGGAFLAMEISEKNSFYMSIEEHDELSERQRKTEALFYSAVSVLVNLTQKGQKVDTPENIRELRPALRAAIVDHDLPPELRAIALCSLCTCDYYDQQRRLPKLRKNSRAAKATTEDGKVTSEYLYHWFISLWEEIDDDVKDFLKKNTFIEPGALPASEFMPIGSSFYVFPEAKKK